MTHLLSSARDINTNMMKKIYKEIIKVVCNKNFIIPTITQNVKFVPNKNVDEFINDYSIQQNYEDKDLIEIERLLVKPNLLIYNIDGAVDVDVGKQIFQQTTETDWNDNIRVVNALRLIEEKIEELLLMETNFFTENDIIVTVNAEIEKNPKEYGIVNLYINFNIQPK